MKSSHTNPESAASAIQAAFRAHRVRTLYKTLSAANSDADRLQRLIQRQETVDAVRFDPRERLRMNESLMALLLRLDSVPGFDPTVREARRKISRRIVGLQEIVDAICETTKVGCDVYDWDRDWCEVVGNMEEEVCRERGGEDMDRFCYQYLGFRCFHRFLSA